MSRPITLLLTVLLLAPMPAAAQRFAPFAPPAMVGANPNGGLNDIAYNDKQGVYLEVWGHPVVYGRFVSSTGAPIGGGPFVIAQQSGSDAMPRVEYSAGSADDDVFLVRFTSELSGGQHLYVRLVRYTANGPEMGPSQLVFGGGALIARAGGLAFNPARRQFLLTWETPSGGWDVFGQLWQMSGGASAPSIAPASAVLNISEMGNAQGTPNVAYDPEHDKYLVVFRGEHPASEFVKGSWARLVSFDANNNVTKSGVIELSSGFGEPAEQNVLYMPEADSFLTFWTDVTRVRDLTGRIVNHAGTPTTGTFPILATSGNEGAADGAYSASTNTIVLAAMREQTRYVQGIEMNGVGGLGEYFQATTAIPSGVLESLYPHVAADLNGKFGISYVNNFQFVWFELLQGPGGSGGGGPIPCSFSLSSTSQLFGASGGIGGVNITTSDTCNWTTGSSADWLAAGSASGSGSGLITYNVASNSSNAPRTATLNLGGQTFTVTQEGRPVDLFTARESARADQNRDGHSDILWRNAVTGQLASWMLNGTTVKVEAGLSHKMDDLNWQVVGTGDFNGDGKPDILWRHQVHGFLVVWFVDGVTVFGSVALSVSQVADTAWKVVAVGDLNFDGHVDIIWQHDSGTVVLWAMERTRVVHDKVLSGDPAMMADPRWRIVGTADMNFDGHMDLVWHHRSAGWAGTWLMIRSDVWQTHTFDPVGEFDTAWRIVGTLDANRDGRYDLLWQHVDGTVMIWAMDGLTRVYTAVVTGGSLGGSNWKVVGPR